MRQVRYSHATLPPFIKSAQIFLSESVCFFLSALSYCNGWFDFWIAEILLYFHLLLWLRFLHHLAPILAPLLFSSFFCYEFSTSTLSLCFLQRLFTFPVSTFIVCLDWGGGRRSRADLVQNLLIFSLHYSTPLHSPSFLLPSKQAIKLLFKNVKHDWVMLGTYKLSQLLLQLDMW